MNEGTFDCLSVSLNPAIDRTLSIPRFAAGQVNRVASEESRPAGKGVNVAVAVANAGFRVAISGFLGAENASGFEALFLRMGVADHCVRIAGSTRTGIKIVDPSTRQTTDINFPGAAPAARDLELLRKKLGLLNARWAVLAGSLPPDVDGSLYATIAADLIRRGVRVAIDTSGEPLRLALAARPTFIKPNVHELEALVGHPLPDRAAILATARELIRGGIVVVIVSMGAEGALFVSETAAVLAEPPAIPIRTTVGAGDAMVAGWIAANLRGLSLTDAARLATAFSLRAIAVDPVDTPQTYFPLIKVTNL